MAEQLPLNFEFRANQTFNDFFPGSNQEIIDHLQKCVAGTGEQQIFLWENRALAKAIYCKPAVIMPIAKTTARFTFLYRLHDYRIRRY